MKFNEVLEQHDYLGLRQPKHVISNIAYFQRKGFTCFKSNPLTNLFFATPILSKLWFFKFGFELTKELRTLRRRMRLTI